MQTNTTTGKLLTFPKIQNNDSRNTPLAAQKNSPATMLRFDAARERMRSVNEEEAVAALHILDQYLFEVAQERAVFTPDQLRHLHACEECSEILTALSEYWIGLDKVSEQQPAKAARSVSRKNPVLYAI